MFVVDNVFVEESDSGWIVIPYFSLISSSFIIIRFSNFLDNAVSWCGGLVCKSPNCAIFPDRLSYLLFDFN